MTNMDRNSDSPASTWLGGTVLSPSAFRVIDRTMKILVKLVTSRSSDGVTDSNVTSSKMFSDVLGLLPTLTVKSGPSPVGAGVLGPVGPFGSANPGVSCRSDVATGAPSLAG